MIGKLKPGESTESMQTGKPAASLSRRWFVAAGSAAAISAALPGRTDAGVDEQLRFQRVATQFIAALGEPEATSGNNAQTWGLWRRDPGPRGVRLNRFDRLQAAGGMAPAKWQFDESDWWLEEHGLIMEPPAFPLPAGKYLVTGDREVRAPLMIFPPEQDGTQRWQLSDGATLYDVTHLACRSARYTPAAGQGSCSPVTARQSDFPVQPGAPMPPVEGCSKQDYTVLLVIGIALEN